MNVVRTKVRLRHIQMLRRDRVYVLAPRDGVGFLIPVCTFSVSEGSYLLWSCSWNGVSVGG
jgi:hypothetical protein